MTQQIALILLDTRNTLDRLWRMPDIPPFVRLTATIIDYAITKCLHEGGWNLYIDPKDERCKIQRIPESRP